MNRTQLPTSNSACMNITGQSMKRVRAQLKHVAPLDVLFNTLRQVSSLDSLASAWTRAPLPNRQATEWRQLTLCAALPIQASQHLRTATNAHQLQKGLAWEMQSGYINSQGRQAFSHFATDQLQELQQQIPLPLQKSACQKLIKGFTRYSQLAIRERVELVHSASQCLAAWLRSDALQPATFLQQDQSSSCSPQQSIPEQSLHEAYTLKAVDMYQQQATTPAYGSQSPASAQQQATDAAYTSRNAAAAQQQATASERNAASSSPQQKISPDTYDIDHAVSSLSPSSKATHDVSAVDSSALRERQNSGAGASTSHWHNPNSLHSTLSDHNTNSMRVPATRHYDGVTSNGTSQQPRPESTATAEEQISEQFDMSRASGVGSTPAAAVPQPDSSYQPQIQLLGHDELTPSVQHQQQPSLFAATGDELDNSTCIPTDSGVTFTSAVNNAEVEVQDEAAAQQQGKKPVKAETIAFQENFAQAAAKTLVGNRALDTAGISQRSAAWMAMRDSRLTASAFANALGLFEGGRETLWAEKLGLVPRFAGNAATSWGTGREAGALQRYEEITGHHVDACSFRVLKDDEVHGWLGASPDGLLAAIDDAVIGHTPASSGVGACIYSGQGAGLLEIKCPFNRGDPSGATPPKLPQWYYMPQVQGLMDIFDRDWCNLFVWTVNGSMLFHIQRDREYWQLCFQVLAEFWWSHVIPAKHALSRNDADAVEYYRPQTAHPCTAEVKSWSQKMARNALSTSFPPGAAVALSHVPKAM